MKQLVLSAEYGLVEIKSLPMASSRSVAEIFNKRHDNILQSVINLKSNIEDDFYVLNFQESYYKNKQGKKQPEILMTKDGFTLLVMGFTGKKATQFKIAYINKFNEMEEFIRVKTQAKLGFPAFTDGVKLLHENPNHFHFSNESDMVNKLVTGMTAKQFKIAKEIDLKEGSIRPYLTLDQIEEIEYLQMLDTGMMAARVSYEQRKMALELALVKYREKRKVS